MKRKAGAFKDLSKSRKISVYLLLVAFAVAQVVSIVCVNTLNSTIQIPTGVLIPAGFSFINLDTSNPDDMSVMIPYTINNEGSYDFANIEFDISLKITFTNNLTQLNNTLLIYTNQHSVGTCPAYQLIYGTLQGDKTYFNISAVEQFLTSWDDTKFYWIFGDLIVSGEYFFRLTKIMIFMRDILLV